MAILIEDPLECKNSIMIIIIVQVFKMAYCEALKPSQLPAYTEICESSVMCVKECSPDLKKPKVHALLHLPKNMTDFGPPSAYNTERYSIYTIE